MDVVSLKMHLQISNRSKKVQSRGAVLPFLAISIPVILSILALVTTVLHQRSITASLQTISDIAAKSGSAAACSTRECFLESRLIAMNQVEDHFLQTTGTLDRDETVSTWNIGDNTITIQRGRWIDGRGFESFEHPWQTENPGIPAFAAYNAVSVKIQRNNILSIFPALLEGTLTSQVQATSVARKPSSAEAVPPFAIPICSLLNDQGNFDKQTACDADRLFTESNRYCPSGSSNCDIVPDFSYSPLNYSNINHHSNINVVLPRIYQNDPNVIPQELSGGLSIVGCSYFSPQYPRASQNFGVVGLPVPYGSNAQVTIAEVDAVLNNVDGKKHNVAIGDPFSILDEGLTSNNSGSRVVQLLDNPLGDRNEYIGFGGLGWDIINLINMSFMSWSQRGGCDDNLITGIARRLTHGVCRSNRNHWGRAESNGSWLRFLDLIGHSGHLNPDRGIADSDNAWKVRIPVIAESGPLARSCLGVNGNLADDPSPATRASGSNYEIIGFITGYLYDSDIGEGPAQLPPIPLKANCNAINADTQRVMDSTFIGKYLCAPWGADTPEDATHPFGFRPDPASPARSCNVVRSRLDCETSLFPSEEDRYENAPYLVN